MDGTLFDSDSIHCQVFEELLARFGIDCPPAVYREKICGRHNDSIFQDFLPSLDELAKSALIAEKEELFRKRAENLLSPLPGLMDLLTFAKE